MQDPPGPILQVLLMLPLHACILLQSSMWKWSVTEEQRARVLLCLAFGCGNTSLLCNCLALPSLIPCPRDLQNIITSQVLEDGSTAREPRASALLARGRTSSATNGHVPAVRTAPVPLKSPEAFPGPRRHHHPSPRASQPQTQQLTAKSHAKVPPPGVWAPAITFFDPLTDEINTIRPGSSTSPTSPSPA